MFKVRKRNLSLSSLNNNPQVSSKLSKRKQIYKNSQTGNNEKLESQRSSRILPKLNVPQKANTTGGQFLEIEMKKQQKNQVKQLSIAISKYYLNRAQYLKKPFHQLAYNILSVVESFSQIQNTFQQLFKFVCQDIKTFMFMTGNAQLSTKYEIKQGEVYKKAVQQMDRASHRKMKEMNEKLREMTDMKQEIEQQFNRSKVYWQDQNRKCLEQIEWLKKISNKQYTTYLEQKLKQTQQRIEELQQSQKQLVRLRDQYEKEIQKQSQTINQQVKQIARLTSILYDMKNSKGESEKLILKLRDRFDQINFKMIGMKDVIETVQKQNQELKTERSILSKRAAVNFQQLTPRPKYNKLINFTQKQHTKKLKSTCEITQFLVSYLKNPLDQEQMRHQLFDQKLNSKKQYHPKLQQALHFRQTTIDSIKQSKQQLNQVRKLLAKNSHQ